MKYGNFAKTIIEDKTYEDGWAHFDPIPEETKQ